MNYLSEERRFRFPDPRGVSNHGLVAVGGNLSPGMLLSAYEQGIFPWYDEDPIAWFSPNPRFILRPDSLHISRRLQRFLRNRTFTVTFDRAFGTVIEACRRAPRRGQDGTWITNEMVEAYTELHRLGHAHSVEVWSAPDTSVPLPAGGETELIGGLYGVARGRMFAGESMVSRVSGAGKAAFVALAEYLYRNDVPLLDCQVHTTLLETFGAYEVPRDEYLRELSPLIAQPELPGDWSGESADQYIDSAISRISSGNRCPR